MFLFQQENLSQHPSVPGWQGLPILIHLAPSLSLTQELRMPVKVNWSLIPPTYNLEEGTWVGVGE